MDEQQELIERISSIIMKDVLEAVDQRIDERMAEQDQTKKEETAKAKETIKSTFRK